MGNSLALNHDNGIFFYNVDIYIFHPMCLALKKSLMLSVYMHAIFPLTFQPNFQTGGNLLSSSSSLSLSSLINPNSKSSPLSSGARDVRGLPPAMPSGLT